MDTQERRTYTEILSYTLITYTTIERTPRMIALTIINGNANNKQPHRQFAQYHITYERRKHKPKI